MSHSACKPLSASVLGQPLNKPADIAAINSLVRAQSFDLLQTDHTLSGIDIALWDLLARSRGEPIWQLLGFKRTHPRIAYASQLFGDDPTSTFRRAQAISHARFRAAKFGWGPYGRGSIELDAEHVRAAREGLGPNRLLLIDAGTVWGDDVSQALERLDALEKNDVTWLEEPFVNGALAAYQEYARRSKKVKLAGGEGCHTFHQARNMIDYAGIGYIQIDTGRIGGITTAQAVARYAMERNVRYVNHTFTTPLALSASLQPYAGSERDELCEYPVEPSALAQDFTNTRLTPDDNGLITLPSGPGLGLEPNLSALQKYFVPVEITVGGKKIYESLKLA